MKIFLQSIDIVLWYIVNERPYATTILDADLDRFRPKTRNELSTQNKVNHIANAKTVNVLYNFSDANDSTRTKECTPTKEIWNKLKEIYLLLNMNLLIWNLIKILIRCIIDLMTLLKNLKCLVKNTLWVKEI